MKQEKNRGLLPAAFSEIRRLRRSLLVCLRLSLPAPAQKERKASSDQGFPPLSALKDAKVSAGSVPGSASCRRGTGLLRSPENREGKYHSLVYGNPCAVHVDPVEKKPFYHLLPASTSFSIATAGCNFRLQVLPDWRSPRSPPTKHNNYELPRKGGGNWPRGRVSFHRLYLRGAHHFYEYMLDTAKLARKEGILNVYHSNGFINPDP